MKLHRAVRSDWSEIAPQQRTIWQRLAASSHGIITPGNIVSLIGAVLVITGLYDLGRHQLVGGVGIIVIGRLCDVLDGMIADYTKTKSPLGESIDASLDKILLILALFVFLDKHLLPIVVVVGLAAHALYNIGVSIAGRRIHVSLHPSRSGKVAAAMEWSSVSFYMLADILRQQHRSVTLALILAIISFIVFAITAFWSSANYTRVVYYKQTMKS